MSKEYYLIGSLRNPEIPVIAKQLRDAGIEVFDSWYSAGKFADDCLRDYEKGKGLNYAEALKSWAAQHIFNFDKFHLDRCHGAILVYPAGKSCHLELGYVRGLGKPGWILMPEEPQRIDVMWNLATGIHYKIESLIQELKK